MGLIAGFILPILRGIPLVLMSPFDWVRSPAILFHAVTKYKGTISWLPNFAFNFCAQKIRNRDLENVNLESWRAVINCSEPMYLKSHQLFQDRFSSYGLKSNSLATCYAMAENVFAVSQGGIRNPVVIEHIDARIFHQDHKAHPASDDQNAITFLSAGQPIEHVEVKIVSDKYESLPEHRVGEIALHSNCMLKGYYHRPDLDRTAFKDDWFLTGDLGYRSNGELFITGRKKDLIIVGGKNIYPQDLENLTNQIEGIHPGRVAVFGIYNEQAGTEDIVLVAELDDNFYSDKSTHERISAEVRLKINQGSDITLRTIRFVPRGWLLKTSSGKIARSANKAKYLTELSNK